MGKLSTISGLEGASSGIAHVAVLNELLDNEGAEFASKAIDSLGETVLHKSVYEMVNSSFIKSKVYPAGSAQYKADRARWVRETADFAKVKASILRGEHENNEIAEDYLAWMALSKAGKARSLIAYLYLYLMQFNNLVSKRGAALIATAAAYSYLGEGDTDPLAAENWVVSSKGVPSKRTYSWTSAMGTGIGMQQWSFYRHDDFLINIGKWATNTGLNSLGTIAPSPKVQMIFAVKEFISMDPSFIRVANKPDSNIDEVLAHFLHVQNGPGYGGRCIARLLNERIKLNELGVLSGDFKADKARVQAYANTIKPNARCPKVG